MRPKCESGERRVDVVELTEFARLYRKPVPGQNSIRAKKIALRLLAKLPPGMRVTIGSNAATGLGQSLDSRVERVQSSVEWNRLASVRSLN